MLSPKILRTAAFLSLSLKCIESATSPKITPSTTSTLLRNSSISAFQLAILPLTQRNLSATVSKPTSQASSASTNTLEFASPQSSSSSNASNTSSTSAAVQEYSFTYPGYVPGSYIEVSYKDTISASWISIPPNHAPSFLIQCWDRNTTTSSTYLLQKPILTTTLASQVDSMTTDFQVPLVAYKDYSPCQLLLQDLNTTGVDGAAGTANSSAFVISDTNSSAGQTWSLNNLAPNVKGASGTGQAAVSMRRLGMMGYVTFIGVLVASVLAT